MAQLFHRKDASAGSKNNDSKMAPINPLQSDLNAIENDGSSMDSDERYLVRRNEG